MAFALLLIVPAPASAQSPDTAPNDGLAVVYAPPVDAGTANVAGPSLIPVVVQPPADLPDPERAVLEPTEQPTPYSWAVFAAGSSVVLFTLLALTRSRRRFLLTDTAPAAPRAQEEAPPVPVPAQGRRAWEMVVERKPAPERILP